MRIVRIEPTEEVLIVVSNTDGTEKLRIVPWSELEGCEVIPSKPLDPKLVAELEAYETPLPD